MINFETPNKIRCTKEHNTLFGTDSGKNYIPNMSDEDCYKFKGKHIKGEDERIEIRKTFNSVQLLIVVFKDSKIVEYKSSNLKEYRKRHSEIQISMNGKLDITLEDYFDINEVITEAIEILL